MRLGERACLIAVGAYLAFLVVRPGSEGFVDSVDNTAQLLAASAAAVAAAAVARRVQGRLRRSWTLLASACGAWAGGQLAWILYEVTGQGPVPQPSLADIGFLAAIPLLLLGVLTYPASGLLAMGRLRLTLDATTIALGLFFAFHGTFLDTALDVEGPWSLGRAVAAAYPLADVVALAIAVPVLLRRLDVRRGPLPLLIVGILGLTVADSYFAYRTAGGEAIGSQLPNGGWVVGFAAIALASRRAGTEPTGNTSGEHPLSRGETVIPTIPVVLAAGVLFARVLLGREIGEELATAGALLLVVLAARQFAIQLENGQLNRNLRLTVDALRTSEDELRHRAFHDPLTDLANRDLFRHRLAEQLFSRPDDDVAVAFIDLDDFKTVNDSLGHDAGDLLLREVAERIRDCLRPGDTVARLGGDEFGVLVADSTAAESLAARVLAAFEAPFTIGVRHLHVSTSVGVAVGAGATHDVQELLQDADLAMYAAKSAGKARSASFHPVMREGAVDRMELLHDLDRAIERDELFVLYQPVQRLSTDAIAGYEALLRWNNPHRGVLLPGCFLDLAEESGRMEPIGWWVLEHALRAQTRFPLDGDGPPPWVSVNLSARQLLASAAPSELIRAIDASGIDPGRIVIELTEGTLLTGEGVSERLAELKRLGVRLAIDDFGIGYSSLSYLARLPFDIVKIDRSFLERMDRDGDENVFVAAIVQLAKSLDIRTIAEGVEHEWQLDILRDLGCDAAQGYLIGRPAPPQEAELERESA
jgi:diguanylate cyclase (GGDEF)-like protein